TLPTCVEWWVSRPARTATATEEHVTMSQPFPWELDDVEPDRTIADPPPAGVPDLDDRTLADPPAPGDEPDLEDDVVDAEIVEEEGPGIPTDALALVLADDTRRAVLSYRDPAAVAVFAKDLRRT